MKVLKEITAVRRMDSMKARIRPRKPTADDHYREASSHYMARTDTHNGEVRKAIAIQNKQLERIASECERLGVFYLGDKTFKCERVKP